VGQVRGESQYDGGVWAPAIVLGGKKDEEPKSIFRGRFFYIKFALEIARNVTETLQDLVTARRKYRRLILVRQLTQTQLESFKEAKKKIEKVKFSNKKMKRCT
jgi:hypothetical protein